MYTLGSLMSVDKGRQSKADLCTVELIKTYHEITTESVPDKFKKQFGSVVNIYHIILKFKVVSDTKTEHTVYIKLNPDFNLNKWSKNEAEIYCDCQDFKFRSAYTLDKNNSLLINNKTKLTLGASITEKPKKLQTTLLCKHAYAAVQWLINNYANVMKFV